MATSRIARPAGATEAGRFPPSRRAFTLTELMATLSIIVLLLAILVPALDQTVSLAHCTRCQNNLHGLGQALHVGGQALTVPSGAAWAPIALANGSRDLLFCDEDDEARRPQGESLEDLYLLQAHGGGSNWRVTTLAAALDMGGGVLQDNQLFRDALIPGVPADRQIPRRRPPSSQWTHRHPCWCKIPLTRADNQYMLALQDEAMILLTFEGSRIVIESIVGCGVTHCGSNHWLMKGRCTNGSQCLQQDEVIMQLGGTSYQCVDPRSPYIIDTVVTSYGINGLIEPKRFGGNQLMLMDADQLVVDVGEPGWMDHVKARHLGKVNVVTVQGGVRSMGPAELQDEYLRFKHEGPDSRSVWTHRAAERLKD